MKILLLGEYSGVHKNLKEGLLELGHRVTIGANGDGWKEIDSDFTIGSNEKSFRGKLSRVVAPLAKWNKFINHDVVQLINPSIFSRYIDKAMLGLIFKNNRKSFLLAAGCDWYYYKTAEQYEYSPCRSCQQIDARLNSYPCISANLEKLTKQVSHRVNGVIPIMYDYAEAYRRNNFHNLCQAIPLPINTIKNKYRENLANNNKIVIFHGLNREGFKGTPIIKEALAIIQEKYPNDVEILIDGKMPLDKYLQIMEKTNIIIDQCNSLSYGMNAVYAMAYGRVVLGGCEPECLTEFGIHSAPIVNIKPDATDIVKKLELFLQNKSLIEEVGYESRKYVENVHDYIKVAEKYIDEWSK